MGESPRKTWMSSRSKESALRAARAVYGRIERSPAAPVLRMHLVQQTRQRLLRRMDAREVLEVLDGLKASGVDVWVAGGWGVDALLGVQTRQHDDLDLIVDLAREGDAQAALGALGFQRIRTECFQGALMPKQIIMRDRAGRIVDLHGVDARTWPETWRERLDSTGRSAVAFDAAKPFVVGTIEGRPVGCLSPELQLASRQVYELTDAAAADARALCARLHLAEPQYLRTVT
jgi:lincosamide nucleotidyltransferase A/C/D/E